MHVGRRAIVVTRAISQGVVKLLGTTLVGLGLLEDKNQLVFAVLEPLLLVVVGVAIDGEKVFDLLGLNPDGLLHQCGWVGLWTLAS